LTLLRYVVLFLPSSPLCTDYRCWQVLLAQCTEGAPRTPTWETNIDYGLSIFRAASADVEETHGANDSANPFDSIGNLKYDLMIGLKHLYPPPLSQRVDPEWLTPLLHQFTIFLAVQAAQQRSPNDPDLLALLLMSGDAVFPIIREKVRPSPDGANSEKIVKSIIRQICGLEEDTLSKLRQGAA
jgi:hypothetical protein